MSTIAYDEQELFGHLQRLPNRLRVAFAAACAERQIPNYVRFSKATGQGNSDVLVRALGCVWNELEGRPATESQLRQHLNACMSLLPDEEQNTDCQFGDYAEDAVSAVAFTIAARLESDTQQAVWASRRAYDALDEFVTEILDIRSVNRNEEERIVAHPLVQAEFRRQREDLSQLQDLAKNPTRERAGITELRHRAEMDAKIFFGPESGSFRSSK